MTFDLDACEQRPPIDYGLCTKCNRWNGITSKCAVDLMDRDKQARGGRTIECSYFEPINLKEERGGGISPYRPNRKASIAKVFSGVEQRLASRDDERSETPYPPFIMVAFALGKLLRYYNSVITGRKPEPTEITEALDYLVMHEMREWGNAK